MSVKEVARPSSFHVQVFDFRERKAEEGRAMAGLNPFEKRRNGTTTKTKNKSNKQPAHGKKKKFNVLGKQRNNHGKGTGRFSEGRNTSGKQTNAGGRRALVQQHKRRWKAGGIIDRRIGSARGAARFALGDAEEEFMDDQMMENGMRSARLTHLGMSLDDDGGGGGAAGGGGVSDDDDDNGGFFDADKRFVGYDDDDIHDIEEERRMQREQTEMLHFGGFEPVKRQRRSGEDGNEEGEEGGRVKSRKEVFEEIIAKSKMYKAERQRQKEQDDEELRKVDEAFRSYMRDSGGGFAASLENVVSKAAAAKKHKKSHKNETEAMPEQAYEMLAMEGGVARPTEVVKEDNGDGGGGYRARRARAKEEEEKLAAAQRDEEGEDDFDEEDDDDNEDDEEEADYENTTLAPKKPKSFLDIVRNAAAEVDISVRKKEMDEEEEEEEEEEDIDESDEDDVEGNEEDEEEEEEEEEVEVDEEGVSLDEKRTGEAVDERSAGVGSGPSSYEEFCSLLAASTSPSSLATILRRLSPTPGTSQPRRRLQELYSMLTQFLVDRVLAGDPRAAADIDVCFYQLRIWSRLVPLFAATAAIARLEKMQARLSTRLASQSRASTWPKAHEFVLIRLWSVIFSRDDPTHDVLQPLSTYIAQQLSHSAVCSARDAAKGVLLAQLYFGMLAPTRKFANEPVLFLAATLSTAVRGGDDKGREAIARLKASLPRVACGNALSFVGDASIGDDDDTNAEEREPAMNEKKTGGEDCDTDAALDVHSLLLDASVPDSHYRLGAGVAALRCLRAFARLYCDLPSFEPVFAPALEVSLCIADTQDPTNTPSVPSAMRNAAADVITTASEARPRAPARDTGAGSLANGKNPLGIATYAPRFEEDFTPGRDYDPDGERAERRKLRRRLRREHRGAVRELRRDAEALRSSRDEEARDEREDASAKMKRARKFFDQLATDARSGGQGLMPKSGATKNAR